MSADFIILVELTGYTDVGVSAVYGFSNRPYTTKPTDPTPNMFYEPRIVDPGYISRQLYFDGASGMQPQPRAEVAYGAITIGNVDGALDTIFGVPTISFRERQVRVLRIDPGADYSTAQVILVGTISQAAMTRELVTVSIKDVSYLLNSPHLTTTYAGNNSLPNGVEGVSDIAGKVKPYIFGKVFAIEPICVNSSRNIYQVSTNGYQSIKVYDGAVQFTAGADYVSQADMETNAPSGGTVRAWPAGGMFRLAARQTYQLTADVVGDTAGNSTVAQILKNMATARGLTVNAADVTALDALNSAVCGIWINDSRTTLECMDEIARSAGVSYWTDAQGSLRMARFDLPSGTAVDVIANWNSSTLELQTTGEDVPTLDVRLNYAKYYVPLATNQLGASVSLATGNDVAQQYRVAKYSASISPNPHKRTQILQRDTLLTATADATAEATRVFGLTSAPRRTFLSTNVFLSETSLATLDLGNVVELRWDRYGFDTVVGTLRRITAIKYYYGAQRCDITHWGT